MAFDLLKEAKNLPRRHLREGSYLYRIGDPNDQHMFVVLSGTLIEVDKNEAFIKGNEVTPGGLVGDIETMSKAPIRLQSYKCLTKEAVLAIVEKREADLMGSLHPEFFLLLLKSAIDKLNAAECLLSKDKDSQNKSSQ
jgi:CRP-like cAMP-binding protein